jgi:hypothetical protein
VHNFAGGLFLCWIFGLGCFLGFVWLWLVVGWWKVSFSAELFVLGGILLEGVAISN